MSYNVHIPQSVYLELNDVALYYEQMQPELGVKFVLDWENTMARLVSFPLHFQKKHKEFRGILLNKFPYLIIYEIEDKDVFVYRLIHSKRNPKKIFKK